MVMLLSVSYITYATSSRVKNGDIITFTQFEEGNLLYDARNLLSETFDITESSNKSNEGSTLPPLISEQEIDTMS